MKLHRLCLAAALLVTAAPAIPGKPGSTTFEPEIAYTLLTGSTELHITDATGAKSATLYSVRQNINIDMSTRSQRQIAISEVSSLKLLTYSVDSTGVKTTSLVPLYSAGSERIDDVDFSPDGTKIAFVQGANKLMVLDLSQAVGPGNPVQWAADPVFIGQIAWYKGGAAIAYVGPLGTSPDQYVFEVAGAGATPVPLLHELNIDMIDASRTDPDALVVTYNRNPGPRAGLWKAGAYVDDDLTNGVFSDFASLNCDDTKLMYGTPDSKGQLIWRIRNLSTDADALYTKTLRVRHTQFVPTCQAASSQTNDAFQFRDVPTN
jgi:hypothetical protein